MATVLVVDDLPANRELLVTLLGYGGHRALEAGDGVQALQLVQQERPDLVICDILMPTMDGYEFVRRLRAHPALADTEVIFHSATFLEHEASRLARACGVSRVLVKPCEPEVFMSVIEQVLAQRAAAQASAARTPAPTQAVEPADFDREHLRLMTDKLLVKADELERANRRLSALTDLNLQLASQHDPHVLLDKVCCGGGELIGARAALLCVGAGAPGGSGALEGERYGSSWGFEADLWSCRAPGWQEAALLVAVQTGRTARRFQNPTGEPAAVGLPDDFPALRNGLIAPIMSLQQVYGWVLLLDRQGADAFSADDEQLLSILAAQAGRIYENSLLYTRLQQQFDELRAEMAERQRAEARVERLHHVATLLGEVNSLIVRVQARAELFTDACRIAVEAGHFSRAWLGTLSPDGALQVQAIAARSPAEADAAALQQVLDALPEARRAALLAQLQPAPEAAAPLVCADTADLRQLGLVGPQGTPVLVALPLLAARQLVALLVLQADSAAVFDADEMKLLRELAGDMSFALDHIAQAEKLDYLAYYDVLTGLANGRLFRERLAQHVGSAAAGPPQRLALALIDLVRFKTVNDTLGRDVGDRLLRQVAERLSGCCAEPSQLARIGSDQFALLCPDVHSESELMRTLAGHYSACFATPYELGGDELRIAARVGIALHPNDGDDVETLYANAEAALKKAKLGTETMLFYNPAMTATVAARMGLENRLRRAVERDELVLHYQPKIDLASGRIAGVEALIRWNSPDGGLILPGSFIPMLEETGMILDVGAWALNRAATDHHRWEQQGLKAPRIAVNVSAVQLQRQEFVATVAEALRLDGIGRGVDIEITESLIMQDVERSVEKLHQLRTMGLDLAIDDFGTGYSSLAYLARLPAQVLKIDKAFIDTMLSDPNHMTLVATMISLAHSLGMKVVAEGVEHEEQARMLRRLHCDQMQGYLISRPLSFEAMGALLLLSQRTDGRVAVHR